MPFTLATMFLKALDLLSLIAATSCCGVGTGIIQYITHHVALYVGHDVFEGLGFAEPHCGHLLLRGQAGGLYTIENTI